MADVPVTKEVPKIIEADQAPPETIPWFKSPQTLAAVAAIGGGCVGISHFLCVGFGICLLDKLSASDWTLGIAGLLAVLGGSFALYRRIKVGLDPKNSASRITIF